MHLQLLTIYRGEVCYWFIGVTLTSAGNVFESLRMVFAACIEQLDFYLLCKASAV